MGIRGEVYSTKVVLQNRTYFFNVKENRLGDLYLNIVESKNRDEGGFERQSVILFAEDLQEFLAGFDESLKVLEKASREKRRSKGFSSGEPRQSRVSDGREPDREVIMSFPRDNFRKDRDTGKPERNQRPKGYFSGRKFFNSGRDKNGAENRRSRFGNKENDRRYEGSSSFSAREKAPRKKRVVVKKK